MVRTRLAVRELAQGAYLASAACKSVGRGHFFARHSLALGCEVTGSGESCPVTKPVGSPGMPPPLPGPREHPPGGGGEARGHEERATTPLGSTAGRERWTDGAIPTGCTTAGDPCLAGSAVASLGRHGHREIPQRSFRLGTLLPGPATQAGAYPLPLRWVHLGSFPHGCCVRAPGVCKKHPAGQLGRCKFQSLGKLQKTLLFSGLELGTS